MGRLSIIYCDREPGLCSVCQLERDLLMPVGPDFAMVCGRCVEVIPGHFEEGFDKIRLDADAVVFVFRPGDKDQTGSLHIHRAWNVDMGEIARRLGEIVRGEFCPWVGGLSQRRPREQQRN